MRVVGVVGASLAGLAAARALREEGFDGRVVLVGEEPHAPYDRPPLSKDFLTGGRERADLALLDDEEDLALDWRLGRRAVRLDPAGRSVTLDDGEVLVLDGVVLATGARARGLPSAAGVPGVCTLRTVDDAVELRARLGQAERVVVVGAGFVGAEVASSARATGREVTVVEALPVPLAGPLGAGMGAVCAGLHAAHGVRLRTGVGVARVVGTARGVRAVELADGTRLPADVVVVGIGARPDVAWLAGSGLQLAGGVVTDDRCATAVPQVVAAGDCAVSWDPRAGAHVRSEHWTHALQQPRTAVATLLSGGTAPPYDAVPYFWSDQYGVRIQFAGRREGADAVRVVEGDPARHRFLAVYERAGVPVAVLAMAEPKLFGRWRRRLLAPPVAVA